MNKRLTNRAKLFYRPYCVYREWVRLRTYRKKAWTNAISKFKEEKPKHGNLSDYKHAMIRHRVLYNEYMYAYEFWRMDEKNGKNLSVNRQCDVSIEKR